MFVCVHTLTNTRTHRCCCNGAVYFCLCVSVCASVCARVYIYSICIYVCVFVCALSVCNRNQRKISILIISEQAPTPTGACITPAQCAIAIVVELRLLLSCGSN